MVNGDLQMRLWAGGHFIQDFMPRVAAEEVLYNSVPSMDKGDDIIIKKCSIIPQKTTKRLTLSNSINIAVTEIASVIFILI